MHRVAYWVLFTAMMAVYLVIVLWSLPYISSEAGELLVFDLRPGGYSFDDAKAFLAVLSEDGREFYLGTQHWLDAIYPVLLGAVLGIGIWVLGREMPVMLRLLGIVITVIGVCADYLENMHVAVLLRSELAAVTPAMVASASQATVIKSVAATLSMILLLGLFLRARLSRRR